MVKVIGEHLFMGEWCKRDELALRAVVSAVLCSRHGQELVPPSCEHLTFQNQEKKKRERERPG